MQPLPADTVQENGRLNKNLFGSEFTSLTILMFPHLQALAARNPQFEFLRDLWHILHILGRFPFPAHFFSFRDVGLVCVFQHPCLSCDAASYTSPSALDGSVP